MQATFQSNELAPRSVRIEFHGQRFVHFSALKDDALIVHYHEVHGHHRNASVFTAPQFKDACRAAAAIYGVFEDTPESFRAFVDMDDPAMTTIREILANDLPQSKAKELLAAAYFNNSWPGEFKATLKEWMQIDDEAESTVPLGTEDAEYDAAPKTEPISLADVVNPTCPVADSWPVSNK